MVRTTTVDASVAVVDRWPLMRIGIARACHLAGMRVVEETGDAVEGIGVARSRGVDLLIVGHHETLNPDLVRQAKLPPGGPAVVVLAGMAGRGELGALLDAGADGLVARTADQHELIESIQRVLAGERVVSPRLLPALAGMRGSAVVTGPAEPLLTSRQLEVLHHLAAGLGNEQIAKTMYISGHTVKTHLSQIYAKLDVKTRHEALARAVGLGLIN